MYFDTSSWQKISQNLYDSGSAIVFVKPRFLTSLSAAILGAFGLVIFAFNAFPYLTQPSLELLLPGVIAVPSLYLIMKGMQGMQQRKESGGVHPTDSVYTISHSNNALRRRIGDMEEQLAQFDEIQIVIHKDTGGKNTRYRIQITWPTGKEHIASRNTKNDAEALLADIRQRLGLPPETITEQT